MLCRQHPLPFAGNKDLMGTRRSLRLITLVLKTLILLFYGASGARCSIAHGNTMDRRSLLDFKEAITGDPAGAFRSWNDIIHHLWCSTSQT